MNETYRGLPVPEGWSAWTPAERDRWKQGVDAAADFRAYQGQTALTAVYPGQGTAAGLAYVVLGLTGEAGEIANKAKKVLRDHEGQTGPSARTALLDEAGDVLWYLARLCTELDADLSTVAHRNLAKLQDRRSRGVLGGEGDSR